MRKHNPRRTRPRALEQNVLKYRAIEMVLMIHYVEDLKRFVVSSIRSSDRIRTGDPTSEEKLPKDEKNIYKKSWSILTSDGIINGSEKVEIEGLIDYRNTIAHAIHDLTCDVSCNPVVDEMVEFHGTKYKPMALKRVKELRSKVVDGMRRRYVMVLSMDSLLFDAARVTYETELSRLEKKIRRQIKERKAEIHMVNEQIRSVDKDVWKRLDIHNPMNHNANGSLSEQGQECFRALLEQGLGELAIAHSLRLSLRSVKERIVRMSNEPNKTLQKGRADARP